MLRNKEMRKKIIKRIEKIPEEKLDDVWKLLRNLENEDRKESQVLAYAGCWKDIDSEILDDLTINLGKRRLQNRRTHL